MVPISAAGCVWQMDQLRNELMQERGVRQDLECDKISLERQVLIQSKIIILFKESTHQKYTDKKGVPMESLNTF